MTKRSIFRMMAKINKLILPRYSKRDINKLSKLDKILIGYRYWVTVHSLD